LKTRSLLFLLTAALATTTLAQTPPSFQNYAPPAPLGADAGEPSIGLNWSTGNAMMQAGLQTLRVHFNADGSANWTDVSSTITSVTTLDPILFTNSRTNRTFVSQLSADCSLMAYSDDDGATWFQNPIGCGIANGPDHQTVGGGAFAASVIPLSGIGYRDTVYYCAQSIATAQCALSINGGITFGPAVPIYTIAQCGGLHGHLRAAPDGTVYVPNSSCPSGPAVSVSANNGLTWTVRPVPGATTQGECDPSVAVGAGGTVYLAYQGGDGHPYVTTSTNRGTTWSTPKDVGTAFAIQNIQFPAVIAGDDDRAAYAFLGTPTAGDDQSASFTGVWHLYVATTYDRGATWTTVDATPADPVQRGCIWLGGGSNDCRNLLDFMDITVDRIGNVYVGYADGCVGDCVSGISNVRSAVATIARQRTGTPLFAVPR
jgi:hypothetical protein